MGLGDWRGALRSVYSESRLTPEAQPEGQGLTSPSPTLGAFFRVSGGYSRKHGQVCPESEAAW